MKLETKKYLAARALSVGKNRIVFNIERLPEIKEAITKQDMKDLFQDKAIAIREIKGKRIIKQRKTRRRKGSIKLRVNNSKQEYVKLTRKLRAYVRGLKRQNLLSKENFIGVRKQIGAKQFKSLAQLKEHLVGVPK